MVRSGGGCPDVSRQGSRVSTMLCLKMRANTTPSWPLRSVTDTAVAMFSGDVVLPIAPPDELAAATSTGFSPNWLAATT